MKLVVLVLLLCFSLGFFLLAYFQGESKRSGYAMMAAFVVLMLSGIFVSGFGLEYRDGYVITDSGSTSDIDYVYISLTTLENIAVGLPLVVSGLWGLIVVGLALREQNREERFS